MSPGLKPLPARLSRTIAASPLVVEPFATSTVTRPSDGRSPSSGVAPGGAVLLGGLGVVVVVGGGDEDDGDYSSPASERTKRGTCFWSTSSTPAPPMLVSPTTGIV